MDEVGPEGQKRLLDGRALVVGASGSAPVIQYLRPRASAQSGSSTATWSSA